MAMKALNFKMEESEILAMKEAASVFNMSVTDLVRNGVREYIDELKKDPFYRLVSIGLGTAYAFQVFLTIGGCIKLIPSTGVTLPLVSYGGSSLLATFMSFSILQGLYITNKPKGEFR